MHFGQRCECGRQELHRAAALTHSNPSAGLTWSRDPSLSECSRYPDFQFRGSQQIFRTPQLVHFTCLCTSSPTRNDRVLLRNHEHHWYIRHGSFCRVSDERRDLTPKSFSRFAFRLFSRIVEGAGEQILDVHFMIDPDSGLTIQESDNAVQIRKNDPFCIPLPEEFRSQSEVMLLIAETNTGRSVWESKRQLGTAFRK